MLSRKALRMLYFSFFVHFTISYGIIFFGGGGTPLIVLKYSELKKKIYD